VRSSGAGIRPSKGRKSLLFTFFQPKKKKKKKKIDALGTFYASLSPRGQPQENGHYFKVVLKEFILVRFISEILINPYD